MGVQELERPFFFDQLIINPPTENRIGGLKCPKLDSIGRNQPIARTIIAFYKN